MRTYVNGEPLTASRCRTRKHGSTVLAQSLLERVEDEVVVDLSVVAEKANLSQLSSTLLPRHRHSLVHPSRVASVMENGAEMRYSFAEICLEGVDTDIHQSFELLGIPFAGFRVGKVDICHPRLPQVPSVRCVAELCTKSIECRSSLTAKHPRWLA